MEFHLTLLGYSSVTFRGKWQIASPCSCKVAHTQITLPKQTAHWNSTESSALNKPLTMLPGFVYLGSTH